MFFRAIDKLFYQLKQFLSLLIFVLIGLAMLFFIYWLLFSAKIPLPDWLNWFMWSIIDFFAMSFKSTPMYKQLVPALPVYTCGVFIILTYIANCIMIFLENNHTAFKNSVNSYKVNLEKTINRELHNDFIKELNRTSFMLAKIRIEASKQESYLTAATETPFDAEALEGLIQKQILCELNSEIIQKKGITNGSVYFLIADLAQAKDFLAELVNVSARFIKQHLKPKVDINFYCGIEVFNDIQEMQEIDAYADRLLNLKIRNKMVVLPRYKVYFENIYPNAFTFEVMGEYNLSKDDASKKDVMVYSIRRKN